MLYEIIPSSLDDSIALGGWMQRFVPAGCNFRPEAFCRARRKMAIMLLDEVRDDRGEAG